MDELQSTKTELIVDELRENAVSLLRRWPEMKYKLHMYLNLPLPPKLQSVAWNFFLSNPKRMSQPHVYVQPYCNVTRICNVRSRWNSCWPTLSLIDWFSCCCCCCFPICRFKVTEGLNLLNSVHESCQYKQIISVSTCISEEFVFSCHKISEPANQPRLAKQTSMKSLVFYDQEKYRFEQQFAEIM